jgi:hypothetical protein
MVIGEAWIVKPPGVTVSAKPAMLSLNEPEVAVKVINAVPMVAVGEAVRLTVEVP